MNINATIFVQIVHFLFALLLLRKFLLRPMVNIIFREHAFENTLRTSVEQEKHFYIHKQEQQKKQWQLFQNEWYKRIPSLDFYTKKKQTHLNIKKVTLPQETLEKEAEKVSTTIKESVKHVE